MNRKYLIYGGVAVAIYLLFFRKKKTTPNEENSGGGGGGGGGGFRPVGVEVPKSTISKDESSKKSTSGTGANVIKGKTETTPTKASTKPPIDNVSTGSGIPSGVGVATTSTGSGTGVATGGTTSGAVSLPKPTTQTTYDPLPTGGTVFGGIKLPTKPTSYNPSGASGGIIPVSQGGSRVPTGGGNVTLPPNMLFTGDTEFADFVVTTSRANFN